MAPIQKSTVESQLSGWAKASADLVVKHHYSELDPVLIEKVRKDLWQQFVSGARHAIRALENGIQSGN